jgi:hypothetical protein
VMPVGWPLLALYGRAAPLSAWSAEVSARSATLPWPAVRAATRLAPGRRSDRLRVRAEPGRRRTDDHLTTIRRFRRRSCEPLGSSRAFSRSTGSTSGRPAGLANAARAA